VASIKKEGSMSTRRLGLFLALAAGLSFVLLPAVPAHAGAGCHNAEIKDVAGTRVDLRDNCFVQTILRVKPGQSVTWTNRDGTEHAVTGVAGKWGDYDTFLPGKSVTYRFSRPGIYPYFCYVHPGMVGAVVVGDGGKATTTESSDAGVVPVVSQPPHAKSAPAIVEPASDPVSASSPSPWRLIALVTLGLLVAAGAGLAAQRLGLRRSQARARAG
jgi:plastocyanin